MKPEAANQSQHLIAFTYNAPLPKFGESPIKTEVQIADVWNLNESNGTGFCGNHPFRIRCKLAWSGKRTVSDMPYSDEGLNPEANYYDEAHDRDQVNRPKCSHFLAQR